MNIQRLAAFSDGGIVGNPAGVVIGDTLPGAAEMQRIAADVGFTETAFAARMDTGWRLRYLARGRGSVLWPRHHRARRRARDARR